MIFYWVKSANWYMRTYEEISLIWLYLITIWQFTIFTSRWAWAVQLQTCIAMGSMARKRLFAQARWSRIKEVLINLSKTLRVSETGRPKERERERESRYTYTCKPGQSHTCTCPTTTTTHLTSDMSHEVQATASMERFSCLVHPGAAQCHIWGTNSEDS